MNIKNEKILLERDCACRIPVNDEIVPMKTKEGVWYLINITDIKKFKNEGGKYPLFQEGFFNNVGCLRYEVVKAFDKKLEYAQDENV